MERRKILACLVICLVLAVSAGIVMAVTDISPPKSSLPDESNTFVRPDVREDAITAVVVRSWGGCGSGSLIWDDLNANWATYGATPISIDYSYLGLCDGPITYDKLVSCGADVVIISDPCGGGQQYDSSEINAIRQYAQDGHNVIGTYLLFQYGTQDNRDLADIFGLRSDLSYNTEQVPCSLTFDILEPENPLFDGITGTYDSTGHPQTQVPISDYSWDDDDLNGARFVAKNTDNKGAITVCDASAYSAIFVSVMPEFGGGEEDKQLFYNAITYVEGEQPTVSITTDCFKYSPGDTMIRHMEIDNPTADPVTFNMYLGAPQFAYWGTIASAPIPAGFSYSDDLPFPVGDWGSTPFGMAWYVELTDGAGEVLDSDAATCAYSPLDMMVSKTSDAVGAIEESVRNAGQ